MKNLIFLCTVCGIVNCEAQTNFQSNVYFDNDKALLRKEARHTLDSLANALKNMGMYRVMVEGHTDSVGTEIYNHKLSERRIKSVTAYLISKGLETQGMDVKPKGEISPRYPNDSELRKQKNRRVDIIVSKIDIPVKQNAQPTHTLPQDQRKYTYEIKLISTPEEMMAKNMSTVTDDGQLLASAGVACVNATRKTTGRNASGELEEYYEIIIPVRPGYCNPASMIFWDAKEVNGQTVWVQTKLEVKEQIINDTNFYVVRTNRTGCKNFDCKVGDPRIARKDSLIPGKFKMKNLTVKKFNLVYRDYVSVIYPKKGKKNRYHSTMIFNLSPEVFMEVKDKKGKTYKVEGKQLSDFKYNRRRNMYIVSIKNFQLEELSKR